MLEKICLIVKKSSGPEPNEPPRSRTQTISRKIHKQSKNRPDVTSTEAVMRLEVLPARPINTERTHQRLQGQSAYL